MTEGSMPQTEQAPGMRGAESFFRRPDPGRPENGRRLQAEWFAVYVESPEMLRLPEAERLRAVYNLRLAEQLGGGDHHPEGPQTSPQRSSTSPGNGRSPGFSSANPARPSPLERFALQKSRG